MSRIRKPLFAITVCALACWKAGKAQGTPSPVVLQIDVENIVNYVDDVSDPSKLATAGSVSTPTLVARRAAPDPSPPVRSPLVNIAGTAARLPTLKGTAVSRYFRARRCLARRCP
jgi:hypothetical protein